MQSIGPNRETMLTMTLPERQFMLALQVNSQGRRKRRYSWKSMDDAGTQSKLLGCMIVSQMLSVSVTCFVLVIFDLACKVYTAFLSFCYKDKDDSGSADPG